MCHDMRILCVDDHVVVLAGLTAIIQAEPDMEVVASATNGRDAIELYRRLKPDVTLMDLQLPEVSGVEAIRAIRSEDAKARIIVLSMFQGQEDIYRALTAGASAYLLKDTLSDNLIRVIREVYTGLSVGSGIVATSRTTLLHASVTPREVQVLELLAKGMRNKEIAESLGISEETVQAHMKSIFNKLDVHDRTAALAIAIRQGIVHLS
jgi:DNA-binding NarL/FixJ family response regulator